MSKFQRKLDPILVIIVNNADQQSSCFSSNDKSEVLQYEKKVIITGVGPDYMVDTLKLPNQAPRGSGKSLQKCVAWRCPYGTQHSPVGQFWPFQINR
ncbi:hypothetical protein TNCV_2392321 [Trichonephila clavipes]|nr:hypothetical protein TNCV_2392321 [Trichonephila clavipes]